MERTSGEVRREGVGIPPRNRDAQGGGGWTHSSTDSGSGQAQRGPGGEQEGEVGGRMGFLHLTPSSSSSCFLLPASHFPKNPWLWLAVPEALAHSHSGPRCHTFTTVTLARPQAQLRFLTLLPSWRVTQTSPFLFPCPRVYLRQAQIFIERLLYTQAGAACYGE